MEMFTQQHTEAQPAATLCSGAGVVDEDYRGAIGVVLFNHGATDFQGTPAPQSKHALRRACFPSLTSLSVAVSCVPYHVPWCTACFLSVCF